MIFNYNHVNSDLVYRIIIELILAYVSQCIRGAIEGRHYSRDPNPHRCRFAFVIVYNSLVTVRCCMPGVSMHVIYMQIANC